MPSLSLGICVITKNESRFIKTCLQSVSTIASEIIIIYSGSTDETLEITASFNAKIFLIESQNHSAYAINIAISRCSDNWIFFLDAVEYLENSAILTRIILRTKNQKTGGFLMERTDMYRNKNNGFVIYCPVGMVWLFSKQSLFKYVGAAHEQINTVITYAGFDIKILKGLIIIYQIYMSDDAFLEFKQQRYLSLIEHQLDKNNNNFWMLYQQAKTNCFLGEKEKAKAIFSAIAINDNCSLILQCSGYCNNAVLLLEERRYNEAIIEVDKSLKINPKQSLGMMVKENIFYQMNLFNHSIQCYRKVKTRINKLKYN